MSMFRRRGFHFYYWCPACDAAHQIHGTLNGWRINEQTNTVSPSVKTFWPNGGYCCHHFIRNGKIEYLSDCTHDMAGQTVDVVDADDWPRKYRLPGDEEE